MRLTEIEKLKRTELKQRVDEAFALADEKGPAYLMQAQFYMRELEHRRDSWVSIRDFILEVVVIALIGWEIWMGYRAERLQTTNFAEEKTLFENLQTNSGATADFLGSLKATTETMNGAIQRQLELFYDVEVTVTYDASEKRIIIENQGRTNVAVWGMHFFSGGEVVFFTEGHIIPGGGGKYGSAIQNLQDRVMQTFARGTTTVIPFFLFLKNEKGEKFTVRGNVVTVWQGDALTFNVQTTQITPKWEAK